jgi:Domain of unknown function (DUF1707)
VSKRGALRASDADRDQVIDRLHRASTEGRIASDELEHRVSAALKARTYDDLEATVSDLPRPGGRRAGREPARRSAGAWTLATVRANPLLLLFAIPVIAVTMAMLLAVTIVWAAMMVVVLAAGGRRHGVPAAPWIYARRHGLGPPRRGPGRHWA